MKIPLQNVDEFGENICEYGYDSFLELKHKVADEYSCRISDVRVYHHIFIGEWCVEVKGKWVGYVEDWEMEGDT